MRIARATMSANDPTTEYRPTCCLMTFRTWGAYFDHVAEPDHNRKEAELVERMRREALRKGVAAE
jgi:hypothetical protein